MDIEDDGSGARRLEEMAVAKPPGAKSKKHEDYISPHHSLRPSFLRYSYPS